MRVIYTSKGISKKFGVRVIYRKIRYIEMQAQQNIKTFCLLPRGLLYAISTISFCSATFRTQGSVPVSRSDWSIRVNIPRVGILQLENPLLFSYCMTCMSSQKPYKPSWHLDSTCVRVNFSVVPFKTLPIPLAARSKTTRWLILRV